MTNKVIMILFMTVILSGCVSYSPDEFGVPVPTVFGKQYPMTEQERQVIANLFLDKYCK